MMDDEVVERVVELGAPIAEVWASLTEPERLSAWLGGAVELDVRVGGRGLVRREDGAVRRMVIETLQPMRRLVIRWWPFEEAEASEGSGHLRRPGAGSRVEFVVEGGRHGTILRVVERAPLPQPTHAVEPLPDAIGLAWRPFGPSSDLRAVAR